ncbi:RagB/SusD family nutrient uptake outer membrane protein [Chitinophaga barathri]|uniref:RagB/SusD family nutrient uptake outer membrane protein n=1 Tax=Chitinophaga barathri TaxID=1647451 RepID=A0A3N4MND8_9BACT|nr:RagB/SusD family nutrient uptake outer membrane protein [Chitinophaga barathri]RPD41149.1 RagB/SusD family nutrient uptake outer membrane protein [Chitinophaga barathri]
MRIFNKKHIIAAVIAISAVGSACNKQLDQQPNGSLSSDLVYTSITAAESAFNGMYSPLYGASYYGRGLTLIPDLLTENLIAGSWFSNSYSDIVRWGFHSGGGDGRGVWSVAYSALHRVNSFLANIDKVEPLPNENAETVNKKKAELKAQAYALRALYMFDLTRMFCKLDLNDPLGLPFVLQPTVETFHARKTVKETYDQIESDLNTALGSIGETNVTRQTLFNKYSIAALQSRFYLYFGKNDLAATAADKVLAGPFGFEADSAAQSKVWINDQGAKEIILKVGLGTTQGSDWSAVNLGSLFINQPDPKFRPNPDFIPSKDLVNLYSDSDLRKGFYFYKDSARQYKDSIWIVKKYPGNPAYTGVYGANAPKLFRYAEVVLNKMEAIYPTNKATAKTLLKSIRASRIKGYDVTIVDAYDDATLLAQIRIERRKELAVEGHYWFDLKRWGVGVNKVREGAYQALESAVGVIAPTDYHWQFPVPDTEMQSNPLMKQNTGYATL